MVLFINNQKKEFSGQLTIVQLVHNLQLQSGRGLALAVNDLVVPKSQWETYSLNELDKITIIKATQGG